MYYISKTPKLSVACKVQKLSEFKGNSLRPDGEQYYVRKSKKPHRIASIPVYVMADGSLRKTNTVGVFMESSE
jgi:hypothetical protein